MRLNLDLTEWAVYKANCFLTPYFLMNVESSITKNSGQLTEARGLGSHLETACLPSFCPLSKAWIFEHYDA